MRTSLKHRELTKRIIGVYYEVFNELGHGFIESIYHKAFLITLDAKEIPNETKVGLPVSFRGQRIGDFEADIIVDNKVILELKAGKNLAKQREVQLLNYLRATNIETGFLFNFGESPEFKRLVFENGRKRNSLKSGIDHLLGNS